MPDDLFQFTLRNCCREFKLPQSRPRSTNDPPPSPWGPAVLPSQSAQSYAIWLVRRVKFGCKCQSVTRILSKFLRDSFVFSLEIPILNLTLLRIAPPIPSRPMCVDEFFQEVARA